MSTSPSVILEILRILQNPMVRCRFHSRLPLVPLLIQINVVHVIAPCCLRSILKCICLTAGVNLLTPSGHRQICDVITTGIDMCGRRMRKGGGGGWTINPSRRWLISCARAAVLYMCVSIALTSCTTSMAETNLDVSRKHKKAEFSKRYRLKRKM